jgi:hypothetical protein
MVKESWDLGIPLFSSQRAHMACPWLLGFKIRKGRYITSHGRKIILPVFSSVYNLIFIGYEAIISIFITVSYANCLPETASLFVP